MNLSKICFTCLFIFSAFSSYAGDQKRYKFDEDPLYKISRTAYFVRQSNIMSEKSSCVFSDMAKKRNSSTNQKQLRELFNEQIFLCEVFQYVNPLTDIVYKEIIRSGVLPKKAYVFNVYVDAENKDSTDDLYSKETIGIFDVKEQCMKAETRARALGLGTNKCYEWTAN